MLRIYGCTGPIQTRTTTTIDRTIDQVVAIASKSNDPVSPHPIAPNSGPRVLVFEPFSEIDDPRRSFFLIIRPCIIQDTFLLLWNLTVSISVLPSPFSEPSSTTVACSSEPSCASRGAVAHRGMQRWSTDDPIASTCDFIMCPREETER